MSQTTSLDSKLSSKKPTSRNLPSTEQNSLSERRKLTPFDRQILVAKLTSLSAVSKAYVKVLKDSVNTMYADELENLLGTVYDSLEYVMNIDGPDQKTNEPPPAISGAGVNPEERSVG